MITLENINKAQSEWGKAIVSIGKMKQQHTLCSEVATESITRLYAFERGNIAFKPTKAAEAPFRPNFESALSYFIGQNPNFPEDKGFALEPWQEVEFINEHIILEDNRAVAMGHYFFRNDEGNKVKVEYTFSYIKVKDGQLKIDVHHSSFPFEG